MRTKVARFLPLDIETCLGGTVSLSVKGDFTTNTLVRVRGRVAGLGIRPGSEYLLTPELKHAIKQAKTSFSKKSVEVVKSVCMCSIVKKNKIQKKYPEVKKTPFKVTSTIQNKKKKRCCKCANCKKRNGDKFPCQNPVTFD